MDIDPNLFTLLAESLKKESSDHNYLLALLLLNIVVTLGATYLAYRGQRQPPATKL